MLHNYDPYLVADMPTMNYWHKIFPTLTASLADTPDALLEWTNARLAFAHLDQTVRGLTSVFTFDPIDYDKS